jgi:hypothetical protein
VSDLFAAGALIGIIAQTIGIILVVFKAARWAGHIDSAFSSLTKSVDALSERIDRLEDRFNGYERRSR